MNLYQLIHPYSRITLTHQTRLKGSELIRWNEKAVQRTQDNAFRDDIAARGRRRKINLMPDRPATAPPYPFIKYRV